MQMAIDVAGFTPAESDELRQAMGSKRSAARMERLRERLYAGMAERGITGDIADELYVKMKAFANYGFPESHSVSFAYLVYASSWIKYHEPAAFCAALLNAQPMGFWSPHTLVRDARRHGVVVRTPDLNASLATATLEPEHREPGAGSRRSEAETRFGTAAAPSRFAGRIAIGDRVGARDRRRPGEGDRGGEAVRVDWRTSSAGCRRSTSASWRRWPRAGCSASASGSSGARRCGRSAPSPSHAPTGWPASSPGRRRRGCPACRRSRRPSPTCGRPACRPTATRRASSARSSTSWASSRRRGCGTSRRGRGSPSPASSPTASGR